MATNDELSKRLAELQKRFSDSGLQLTDGSDKIKGMVFVGGVRRSQPEKPGDQGGKIEINRED